MPHPEHTPVPRLPDLNVLAALAAMGLPNVRGYAASRLALPQPQLFVVVMETHPCHHFEEFDGVEMTWAPY